MSGYIFREHLRRERTFILSWLHCCEQVSTKAKQSAVSVLAPVIKLDVQRGRRVLTKIVRTLEFRFNNPVRDCVRALYLVVAYSSDCESVCRLELELELR